jgi:hypothetical protein
MLCKTCNQNEVPASRAKKSYYICNRCFHQRYGHGSWNPEKEKLWIAQRVAGKQAYILECKQVGCCLCPENDSSCLDFHHVTDKYRPIAHMITGNYSLDTLKKEIAKCVILCSNCHRKLHAGKIALPVC